MINFGKRPPSRLVAITYKKLLGRVLVREDHADVVVLVLTRSKMKEYHTALCNVRLHKVASEAIEYI